MTSTAILSTLMTGFLLKY
ncbi:hypothetical protein Goklo_022132 [Gossypium klotzschianum]|uniref:Uncharacterized protein n=1 Tax=Gossypium klotzschianum TaxID=34286 RepID=A0A7J8TLL7_9ROSI|nr:hypothetical protein [Gossypium klotzschianum]